MDGLNSVAEAPDEYEHPKTHLSGCEYNSLEFLFCKLLTTLINNDERLIKAKSDFLEIKFDVEQRLNLTSRFSPVSMFQRIDRASKGYFGRQEMLTFLKENGFREGEGYEAKDLALVMKNKMYY